MATTVYSVEAMDVVPPTVWYYGLQADALKGAKGLREAKIPHVVREHVVKERGLKDKICSLLNQDSWCEAVKVIREWKPS